MTTTPDLFEVDFRRKPLSNNEINKLGTDDRAVHDWYRFVLSFPPHVVREYLAKWEISGDQRVLDPFSGTGTTVVECKKLGLESIGLEAHPMAHFASQTKVDWGVDSNGLLEHAQSLASKARTETAKAVDGSLRMLKPETADLLLTNSISSLPLHKTLILSELIESGSATPFRNHERLALARMAVSTASNLKFGPEVGVGPPKNDAPVVEMWLKAVREMASDIEHLRANSSVPASVLCGDARQAQEYLQPKSIDAVFTSPPYPNEKDYSRTTRLETVLLGFATNKKELQAIKKTLLRSNTRNVYKQDDDDVWVQELSVVQEIAKEIERKRVEMGKTSGFERLYARVTKLYFGGMVRHLTQIRPLLRSGARLGYMVGDQASFLRVMIPTGEILSQIAKQLGYEVLSLDLFRTRLATATKTMMREEVLVLRWP